jgi:hypothetical protein
MWYWRLTQKEEEEPYEFLSTSIPNVKYTFRNEQRIARAG